MSSAPYVDDTIVFLAATGHGWMANSGSCWKCHEANVSRRHRIDRITLEKRVIQSKKKLPFLFLHVKNIFHFSSLNLKKILHFQVALYFLKTHALSD